MTGRMMVLLLLFVWVHLRTVVSDISVSFESSYSGQSLDYVPLCKDNTTFVTVCKIPTSDFGPNSKMAAEASDASSTTLIGRDESTSGFYRFKYKVIPKTKSIITITCSASNITDFPDLIMTANDSISVFNPIFQRPMIAVLREKPDKWTQHARNGGKLTVQEGESFLLFCSSACKYPDNSSIVIGCGREQNTSSSDGDSAILRMDAIQEDDGDDCYCHAGKAALDTRFVLDVHYKANVTGFTGKHAGGSFTNTMTVNSGDKIVFDCTVIGNPAPKSVSYSGQRSGRTFTDKLTGLRGQYESRRAVLMGCLDADVYSCQADNGLGDPSLRTLKVFVKCGPHFQPSFHQANTKEYFAKNGTRLEVNIPIYGFPSPTNYTLTQDGLVVTTFNVTYLPGQHPMGTVKLTFLVLTNKNLETFEFSMDNGIDYLRYNFAVKTEKDSSSGLSTGAWVGVGVGVSVAFLILVFVVAIGIKKVQNRRLDL